MTSDHRLGFNPNDNASEAGTSTTWGNDWPQVGISRSQLYNGIIKAGYESSSYIEVGNVIKNLLEWKELAVNELSGRIANSADPNILPDPVLHQSLQRLLFKVHLFCDRHLLSLRQRVQQLRSEDTVVLDLLDLADDEDQDLSPPAPLQFDASYNTTLLDTPNVETVRPNPPPPRQTPRVESSTPVTVSQPRPDWPVSAVKTTQASNTATPAQSSPVETLDSWAEKLLEQIYNYHKNIYEQLALTGQFSPTTLTRYVTSTLIQAVPPPDVVERMISCPGAQYDLGVEIRNIQGNVRRLDLLRTKLNDMAYRRRHVANRQEKDIVESMGIAIEQELERVMLVFDRLEEMVKAAIGRSRFEEMVSYVLPNFHESISATLGHTITSPLRGPVVTSAALTTTAATTSATTSQPKVRFSSKVSTGNPQPPTSVAPVVTTQSMPICTTGTTTVVPPNIQNTLAPPAPTRPKNLFSVVQPNAPPRFPTYNTPVVGTTLTQSHTVIPHPRPPVTQVSSGQIQSRILAPSQVNPVFTLGQQSAPTTTQTIIPLTPAPQPPVAATQVAPPYTRPPTAKITEFDGSVINATQWLKNYVTVTRAMGWNDQMRANLFSNYMTGPALLWFQSRFGAQNDESIESLLNPPELSLSDIFTAFQERFRSRHARMEFERDYIFFAPKPEESLVETFWRYQKISGLVSASTPILDRIHHLSRRLFEYNPTVAEQISPCKTFEQVESTMQRLSAVGFKSRNADDNKNKTTVVQPNAQKGPSNRPDDNIDQVGLLKGDRPIKPVVDVVISGKVYRALLDDGSENSFISTRVAHFIKGFRKVKWDRSAITTANGQVITPETAFADLNIQIPALAVDEKCYVGLIKNLAYDLILGEDFQESIRLIKNYGNRTLYIMENFDELYRQHKKKNDRKFQWSLVEESDQPRSNICLLTSSFSDQCPLTMAKMPNKRERRSTTSEAQNVGKVKSKDGQVVSGRLRCPSSAPGGSRNYPTVRSSPRRRGHTHSDFRRFREVAVTLRGFPILTSEGGSASSP